MSIDPTLLSDLEVKKDFLLHVGHSLKKDFVGLDSIIDKIISSIEVWYTFPALLTRPLVINLWGMTGVGKTDLVRKLVSYLQFKDKYLEIQLNSSTDRFDTVQSKLINLNISSYNQAVLLLDEIQKYRTRDEQGKMISGQGYNDIWELLSDGSFSDAFQEKFELQMYLYQLFYEKEEENEEEDDSDEYVDEPKPKEVFGKKHNKNKKFRNYVFTATKFKRITESDLSIEEVMQLTMNQQIEIITEKIKQLEKTEVRKKYNSLLIFICGNIDDAYSMSDEVSEVDTDADILHEKTKKISIIDIKQSLSQRFAPEQIARLGNNHVIYPSFSKESYKEIIQRCLTNIRDNFFKLSGVSISYKEDVLETIYANGVFPSQGIRPLFSTVNNLIENSIPEFLLHAIKNDIKCISVSFNSSEKVILASIGEEVYKKSVELTIDNLKQGKDKNFLSLVAAHEAGHAVAYMCLFGIAPVQICCDAVNFSEGFVVPHNTPDLNKQISENLIQVFLAGKVAEEIIFGEDHSGGGVSADIAKATMIASDMVRSNNMGDNVGKVAPIVQDRKLIWISSIESTDTYIEKILINQKSEVRKVLAKNKSLLKDLIKTLKEKRKLLAEDIFEVSKKHLPNLRIQKSGESIHYGYGDILDKFLSQETGTDE